MSLGRFLKRGEEPWRQLHRLLRTGGGKHHAEEKARVARIEDVPRLFRRVCHDLALAKHRQYGAGVVERLNHLALDAHNRMYRSGTGALARVLDFVAAGFPRLLRAEAPLMFWSCLLLFGPGIALAVAIQWFPEIAYSVLDGAMLESVEEMYDPSSDHIIEDRQFNSDFVMFGLYVQNNIGIAFRVYAGGLLFGFGTVFFLLFNSFVLGTLFGHVTRVGGATPLYSFAIGHGAFELIGIAIAGAAGLRLGLALCAPGRRTRAHALREAGRRSVPLVAGAGAMLTIAAFIEAFWSPRAGVPPQVKYSVGFCLWALCSCYLALAGRGRRGA